MAEIRSEMAANVWKFAVEEGATVEVGDTVVILESMKMEIPVESEHAGSVTFAVEEGQYVEEDDVIATVE